MIVEAFRVKTNVKLGREIFEFIPGNLVPIWAKHILSCFDGYMKQVPDSIKELYANVDQEDSWHEAYKRFCEIREYSLWNLFDQPEEYFQLAENVAKVTYNSSSGSFAVFDKNSGWFIPSLAMKAADYYKNEKLKNELLSAILVFHHNDELVKPATDIQAATDYLLNLRLAM